MSKTAYVCLYICVCASVYVCIPNGTACLKNVSNCLNTNIYSYLVTSGGQSYGQYLNVVYFSTPVLSRHLRQLKFSCIGV